MNIEKTVAKIMNRHQKELTKEIAAAISLNGHNTKDSAVVVKRKPKVIKVKSPRSASVMRCRHEDKHGTRCRARSKGPRFRFLCQDHLA